MSRTVIASMLMVVAVLASACSGADTSSDAGGAEAPTAAEDQDTASAGDDGEAGPAPTLSMGIQEGAGSNLPSVVAREIGAFEEQGLDVEFVPLAGSALLGAVASGDIQFFSQAVQLVGQAIQSDVQLRFFCGSYPTNWSTILVPTAAGLTSTEEGATWQEALASLEGSTLGVAALGATQEHWILSLLRGAGVDEDALTLVPVGVGPSAVAALQGGQVDAVIGYSFINQQLAATGETEVLLTFDETGPEFLGDQMNTGFVAPLSWLEENPETADAVCTALGDAMAWAADEANAEQLGEILAGPDFGIDDPAVRDEILASDGILPNFSPEIDCERLERAADFFVEFGTFDPEPPISCETAVWEPTV